MPLLLAFLFFAPRHDFWLAQGHHGVGWVLLLIGIGLGLYGGIESGGCGCVLGPIIGGVLAGLAGSYLGGFLSGANWPLFLGWFFGLTSVGRVGVLFRNLRRDGQYLSNERGTLLTGALLIPLLFILSLLLFRGVGSDEFAFFSTWIMVVIVSVFSFLEWQYSP